jgi:hypothetical protein
VDFCVSGIFATPQKFTVFYYKFCTTILIKAKQNLINLAGIIYNDAKNLLSRFIERAENPLEEVPKVNLHQICIKSLCFSEKRQSI